MTDDRLYIPPSAGIEVTTDERGGFVLTQGLRPEDRVKIRLSESEAIAVIDWIYGQLPDPKCVVTASRRHADVKEAST